MDERLEQGRTGVLCGQLQRMTDVFGIVEVGGGAAIEIEDAVTPDR